MVTYSPDVTDDDLVFKALADPTRRFLLDLLFQRDGRTLKADFVQVNPLAAISGDCRIGPEVLVGTTACVLQGRHVGEGATVGAGACVTRDVDSERTGATATRDASTPSNRRVPAPKSTGDSAIENSSTRPALRC